MDRITKITINLPKKLIEELDEIWNNENSFFTNRGEYIKVAIIEKNEREKDKKKGD